MTSVVGSASIWVLGQVAGPRRTGRVLHVGSSAVYLELEGGCLAVLGARAVQVPCGVRTEVPTLPDVEPGTEVLVEDGAIVIPGLEVLVTNIVDTTVPVLSPATATWGGQVLDELLADRLDDVRSQLPEAPLAELTEGDANSVQGLLGLGGGLTPLGDDVLCGWLATAVASRHPALPDVRSAVALAATERTTTLSATLLACAARGEGVPQFRSLLVGVNQQNHAVVEQAVDLMLQIGETSGAGNLLGGLIALQSPSLLSPPAGQE
jgi:hypothetical protein